MRAMYRYKVPVDDQAHIFTLTGLPVAVAATEHGAFGWSVEFWAEHVEGAEGAERAFQAFGTGYPLPPGARWVGTCPRLGAYVWHLYVYEPGAEPRPELPAGVAEGDGSQAVSGALSPAQEQS